MLSAFQTLSALLFYYDAELVDIIIATSHSLYNKRNRPNFRCHKYFSCYISVIKSNNQCIRLMIITFNK